MEWMSSSSTGGGAPVFRFLPEEIAQMEALVQQMNHAIPDGLVLVEFANKFTASRSRLRAGMVPVPVQPKQVLCWFRKRRYSSEGKANQHQGGSIFRAQTPATARAVSSSGMNPVDNVPTEQFEAKSARDGAWYDVAAFLLQRGFETGDPEVKVRFSGLGGDADEWINVLECLRPRSLPYEGKRMCYCDS